MSRFEVVKEIASNQNYELLENHLHEDFMLIREEGLVLRDEYLEYVKSHFADDSEPDRVYRRRLSSYCAARVTVFKLS